jgi:ElaB/YqjD/DUF883 family membrane-anchored ribosome-binding protein
MSRASDELEQQTDGSVPTADEVIAATGVEAADALRGQRVRLESDIRQDPIRSVFISAGIGVVAAMLLRRL